MSPKGQAQPQIIFVSHNGQYNEKDKGDCVDYRVGIKSHHGLEDLHDALHRVGGFAEKETSYYRSN